jgi:hypothetical protein
MKNINIPMDDEDFDLLTAAKGDMTWLEFMMTLVQSKKEAKK